MEKRKKVTKKTTSLRKVSKKKQKSLFKAFTLIELLAVIIILGIIMLIAIPSVTKSISSSRDKSYISSAKEFISGARTMVNTGELDVYNPEVTYYIPISCISTENSGSSSPYGEWENAYVVFTYEKTGYDYYWTSIDGAKQGIYLTSANLLDTKSIIRSAKDLNTGIAISGHNKISILDEETCRVFSEPTDSTYQMDKGSSLSVEQYEEANKYITIYVNDKSYSVLNNTTWINLKTSTIINRHQSIKVDHVAHRFKYVGNKSNVTFCVDATTSNKNIAFRVYKERYNATGTMTGGGWISCIYTINDNLGVNDSNPFIFFNKTITEGELNGLTFACVEPLRDSSNNKPSINSKPTAHEHYHTNHECDDFTLVDINFTS